MARFLFSVLVSTLVSVADAGSLKGADGKDKKHVSCRLLCRSRTDSDPVVIYRRSVVRSKKESAVMDGRSSHMAVATTRSVCFFVKE